MAGHILRLWFHLPSSCRAGISKNPIECVALDDRDRFSSACPFRFVPQPCEEVRRTRCVRQVIGCLAQDPRQCQRGFVSRITVPLPDEPSWRGSIQTRERVYSSPAAMGYHTDWCPPGFVDSLANDFSHGHHAGTALIRGFTGDYRGNDPLLVGGRIKADARQEEQQETFHQAEKRVRRRAGNPMISGVEPSNKAMQEGKTSLICSCHKDIS
jgi:hypothetical protein